MTASKLQLKVLLCGYPSSSPFIILILLLVKNTTNDITGPESTPFYYTAILSLSKLYNLWQTTSVAGEKRGKRAMNDEKREKKTCVL